MRIQPYLSVLDVEKAIEFYVKVFDATEPGPRLTDPFGKIVHTEIQIGESRIMMADENPDFGNLGPQTLGGSPVRLALEVDDPAAVDALFEKAAAAGAEILVPPDDQFYGYRAGRLADPGGHVWLVSAKIEDVSAEEMQRRLDEMFGGG